MNELAMLSGRSEPTMSSLEIAERTGKRHADVMRDVRTMLEQLGNDERSFASVYRDAKGEARPCFELPKDLTMTLITGYSIPLRKAVLDRLHELEEAAKQPANLNDPATLRRLLAYTQRTEAAEAAEL
jgi:phage regulator Rha-like protein